MAKYRGRDRAVFLDGYAAGWKDGVQSMVVRLAPGETLEAKDKLSLRYTDAPRAPYAPGGPVTGTELQKADMMMVKRKSINMRGLALVIPTKADLAVLGPRVACAGEAFCPVAPGCHICGLTNEEVAILDKRRKGGV